MKNVHQLHRATLTPEQLRIIEINTKILEEEQALREELQALADEVITPENFSEILSFA